MQTIMYLDKPEDFSSKISVVGCYIENNNKFLLLQYADHKLEDLSNKWGMPAGKIDPNEAQEQAVLREVYEETKLWLTEKEIVLVDTVYFREPFDYTYYIFKTTLSDRLINKIELSYEHKNYCWANFQEAIKLPLVYGAQEAFRALH